MKKVYASGPFCRLLGSVQEYISMSNNMDIDKVLRLCSTQLSTKFILLINVKITTVGILAFISMII